LLRAVLDVGLGPIVAAREFAMPLAAFVLVFDAFGLSGLALLGRRTPRRFERLGLSEKAPFTVYAQPSSWRTTLYVMCAMCVRPLRASCAV
jgi:hypothetical protein